MEFDFDSIDFSFESGEASSFSVDGSPDGSLKGFDDSLNFSLNRFDFSFNGFDFSLSFSLNCFDDSLNCFDDSLNFSLSFSLHRFVGSLAALGDSLHRPVFALVFALPASSPRLSLRRALPTVFFPRGARSSASSVSLSRTFAASPQFRIHSASNSALCARAKLLRREFAALPTGDSLRAAFNSLCAIENSLFMAIDSLFATFDSLFKNSDSLSETFDSFRITFDSS